MRELADWLRRNTEATATIALEPIGEVSFYVGRRIVDLGGLTNNDIWRCLERGYNDPRCVIEFLDAEGVDYLVDRPADSPLSFHAIIDSDPERFERLTAFQGDNLVVYRIRHEPPEPVSPR
jgi:hypothetical protein